MSIIEQVVVIANILFVSLAVLWDIRVHKIPNVINIILVIFNLLSIIYLSLFTGNSETDLSAILIVLIKVIFIFFILYPFYSIGTLGAGDIKLIVATSLGVKDPLLYTFVIFMFAAVMAIFRMCVNHNAKSRIINIHNYLSFSFHNKPLNLYEIAPEVTDKLNHSVHLSIPVLFALLINIIFKLSF